MKLSDQLRALATAIPDHAPLLTACADKLEESRQWKLAWTQAELRNEQLTQELKLLRSKP
jgi:hypothetical protein